MTVARSTAVESGVMQENPYQSPDGFEHINDENPNEELAPRWRRVAATMLDGLITSVVAMPIFYALPPFAKPAFPRVPGFVVPPVIEQSGFFVAGAMLLVHGYPLVIRGQTIGKLVAGIQIVDHKTDKLLPFARVVLVRYLFTFLVYYLIFWLILKGVGVPGLRSALLVFALLVFLDGLLMMCGRKRQCLHDLAPRSKVVLYQLISPE